MLKTIADNREYMTSEELARLATKLRNISSEMTRGNLIEIRGLIESLLDSKTLTYLDDYISTESKIRDRSALNAE